MYNQNLKAFANVNVANSRGFPVGALIAMCYTKWVAVEQALVCLLRNNPKLTKKPNHRIMEKLKICFGESEFYSATNAEFNRLVAKIIVTNKDGYDKDDIALSADSYPNMRYAIVSKIHGEDIQSFINLANKVIIELGKKGVEFK